MKTYINFILFFVLVCCLSSCFGDLPEPDIPKAKKQITEEKQELPPRIKLLNERLATDTANAELYFARANAFLEIRDINAASSDILLAMKHDSTEAKYYLTASDILIQSGNGTAAIKILQNGLGRLPDNTTIWLERAKLHYYLRQYDEATLSFQKLLTLNPTMPEAFFYRGLMNKELEKIELAKKDFETAIEHNPDFYDALMQLGLINQLDNPKLAIAYLDNALRLDPQSSEALYAKGIIYQSQNNYKDAKKTYKKIVSFDKQNANTLYNLGVIYFNQDSLDLAKKHFDMAVLVEPTYYRGYYMRGKYYELEKDIEKAKVEYQNALNINPEHQQSKDAINRIKN